MNTRRFSPLHLLVASYFVLAVIFWLAVPLFESPDESTHMAVVDFVASTGQLPVQVAGEQTAWGQQGSQPPLYYLLASTLIAGLDRSDIDQLWQLNPHAIVGDPSAFGNRNSYLHDAPYPPDFSGAAGAVYMARAFSIMLGGITVIAVYRSAHLVAPHHPGVALLAASLAAFTPQFLFISASVNNDNLVTALNSVILWQTLAMLRDGLQTRRSLLLGVLVALATISKLSGWVVAPAVVCAGLWTAYCTRAWRGLVTLFAALAVGWLALASWWYVRNWTLYGEFFGTQTMLDIFGRRPAPTLLELVQNEFEGLRVSFWALFGWFNVPTAAPFYALMDILTLLGVAGLVLHLWRARRDQSAIVTFGLLALSLVVAAASLISWTRQTAASQGRLLFPVIVPISVMLAVGLRQLRMPALAVTLPMGAFAALVPLITIIPTYAPPPTLAALPESAAPLDILFGTVRLAGYETAPNRYAPGDIVPVTLYWQPTKASDLDYSMFIRLVNPANEIVAVLPTYPGYGRLRTTTWTPGVIYADSYPVRIPADSTGQFALSAYVGWWKYPEGYSVEPTLPTGEPADEVLLDVGALVAVAPPISVEHVLTPVSFGEVIALIGYTLHEDWLTLLWEAAGQPGEDYTVMAFALQDEYKPGGTNIVMAQGDAPPAVPTRFWRAGDRFSTQHRLQVSEGTPPGEYPIYVGWYSTLYPARLQVAAPDNAYRLTTLRVPFINQPPLDPFSGS